MTEGELSRRGHGTREKLVEVEEPITDLETIRDNLTAGIDALCDDLVACGSAE